MKRTTLSNHLNAFRDEALFILRFQLAYNRIIKFEDLKEIGRSNFVDRILALKAIENDLVIRICKFDDDTKGVHSFKKAQLEIEHSHPNKQKINDLIKHFSLSINRLKNERRHKKLAHLQIGEIDSEYDLKYNLTPIIKLIIEIIDLINIKKINYEWSDGAYEKFNLRSLVLEEEIKN